MTDSVKEPIEWPESLKKLGLEMNKLSESYSTAERAKWAELLKPEDFNMTADEVIAKVAEDPTVAALKKEFQTMKEKYIAEEDKYPEFKAKRSELFLSHISFAVYNEIEQNIQPNGANVYHGYWTSPAAHPIIPYDSQTFSMEDDAWAIDADWKWCIDRADPRPTFFLKWRVAGALGFVSDDAEAWITPDARHSEDKYKIDLEGVYVGRGKQDNFVDYHIKYNT